MRLLQKQKKKYLHNRNNVNISMLKDVIIDEANLESMADLEKTFRVQNLYPMHRGNTTVLIKFDTLAKTY